MIVSATNKLIRNIYFLFLLSLLTTGWGQDCGENMYWSECGLPFGCHPTCADPYYSPDACLTYCEIGCFCESGYVYFDESYSLCVPIEDCVEPSLCDEGYTELNGECYYQSDLDVLDIFISNSSGSINLILDDNGDGVIEPLELCSQHWIDGRLTSIDCSPIIIAGNYNWLGISGEIPTNISNWTEIQFLSLYHNELSGLVPNTICSLDIDFSDPNTFTLYGNNLCPPFPECVEDYMGSQSNWGTGSCEIGNCYDIGVTAFTALEENGDNFLNTYEDVNGIARLLVNLYNDGPDCSTYPGLMITSEVVGVDFPDATSFEPEGSYTNWWYAMFADDTYFSEIPFEVSPYVPIGTEIIFTARAIIMNCLDEGCIEDPYCHDCPLTDPMSITLTIGDLFPSELGDANMDGEINVLDVVLLVSFILMDFTIYYPESDAMQIYLSNMNQDSNIDVLDVVIMVDIILNP